MVAVGPNRWLVERYKQHQNLSTQGDSSKDAFQSLRLQRSLANIPMLRHRQGHFLLDRTFALIEGHPALCSTVSLRTENLWAIRPSCYRRHRSCSPATAIGRRCERDICHDAPLKQKQLEWATSEKERQQNRTVLFPIRLDDAIMETHEAWAADIRRTRNVGDFRNWKNHDSYKKTLDHLLRDLQAEGKSKLAA
jgi:hypothetical protein